MPISSDHLLTATIDSRRQNSTSRSQTGADIHFISDNSVSGGMVKTGDSASKSTRTSSSPNSAAVAVTHSLNETGRGRWVTSASVRTSSFTGGQVPAANSSADDTWSPWPRRVLLKSANSTDNGPIVYWSSQSMSTPHLLLSK